MCPTAALHLTVCAQDKELLACPVFSSGVEVGQEAERAVGAGVLPASSLCSLVLNYVLKARQTSLVLQFPLVFPKHPFHFAHDMAWDLE